MISLSGLPGKPAWENFPFRSFLAERGTNSMADFTPPSNSELDCLVVLWTHAAGPESGKALRVSEIHRDVCERRRANGEPEPTVVTISSQVRSLLQKHLVRSVVSGAPDSDAVNREAAFRTRGMLSPATRSPLTAYQFLHPPGEVLQSTFSAMISAYPESERPQALVDFADALIKITPADSMDPEARIELLHALAARLRLPPAIVRQLKSAAKRRH
jgi:hypothetical protein